MHIEKLKDRYGNFWFWVFQGYSEVAGPYKTEEQARKAYPSAR